MSPGCQHLALEVTDPRSPPHTTSTCYNHPLFLSDFLGTGGTILVPTPSGTQFVHMGEEI